MKPTIQEQIAAINNSRRDLERELRNGSLSGEDQNFLSGQLAALNAALETLRTLRDLNEKQNALQAILNR